MVDFLPKETTVEIHRVPWEERKMNYQLHDSQIDAVLLEGDRIIFSFPNGFYAVDDSGQELKPLPRKLVFTIEKYAPDEPLESHIFIRRITGSGNGWRDISFQQFTALLHKGNMIIHDEYDSKFTNWKILKLNACTKRPNIELHITDIAACDVFAI